MATTNPTDDYRKYPKGPNFLGIVIAFGVAILLILAAAILFLSDYGKHLLSHANTEHSVLMPATNTPQPMASSGKASFFVSV